MVTYITNVPVKNSQRLPEVATASRVSSRPTTVQGWRPTSVTTHPASSDTSDTSPLSAAHRRNQRLRGRSRRRHHPSANHSDSPSSRHAVPTIRSKGKWTFVATRRSAHHRERRTERRPPPGQRLN